VAIRAAELGIQEGLNQFPGQGRAHNSATKANKIHVVILHPLMSRKGVMNQRGPNMRDLVGRNASADPASAYSYAALDLATGNGLGQRNHEIRVIIGALQVRGPEVDYSMALGFESGRHLLFQTEASMISSYTYSGHLDNSFSLSESI